MVEGHLVIMASDIVIALSPQECPSLAAKDVQIIGRSNKQIKSIAQNANVVAKMPLFGGVPKVEVELTFATAVNFYDDFREEFKAQLRAKGVPTSYCFATPDVKITNTNGHQIEEPIFKDYPIAIKFAIPYTDVQHGLEPERMVSPLQPATIDADCRALQKRSEVSVAEAHRLLVLTKQRKWQEVRAMIEDNSALIDFRFKDHWTLLHHAAFFGDIATIHALVRRCASLSAKTSEGLTPSEVSQDPAIRKLLEDARGGNGDTFWSFAEAICEEGCNMHEAVSIFERRLAAEEVKGDHEGRARAHYHIGRSKGNLADYDGERQAYEAATAALCEAGVGRSEFAAEVLIGRASISPTRLKADELFAEARAILGEAGAKRSKTGAQLLLRTGAKKRVRGDLPGSFADLNVAVALLRELNTMRSRLGLDVLLALSRTKRDMRNFAGEKATADEALEIADAIGVRRTSSGADVLVNLAIAKENLGQLQGAINTYSEVREVLQATEGLDTVGGGNVLFNMGCLQAKLGHFEAALSLFREVLPIFTLRSPQEVPKCERVIASCLRRL